ncbi:CDC7 protein kinase [Kwoniella heveanensis CBS 569]|nr:CDC7 protein kinase [Kwoniella heveanensis CBS 569]
MTSIPSTSTTFSPPHAYITGWPPGINSPSSRYNRRSIPLRVPQSPTSTSKNATASNYASKRQLGEERSGSPEPSPKRQAKRVREATPIFDDANDLNYNSVTETESTYLTVNHATRNTRAADENASAPASMYPTTVAGPSSYAQENEASQILEETSEGGDGEGSILFSEQAGAGAGRTDMINVDEGAFFDDTGLGDETIIVGDAKPLAEEGEGEFFMDDVKEEDAQETGEDYLIGQEEQLEPQDFGREEEGEENLVDTVPATIDLRQVMPPPADTTSHKSIRSTSSRHSHTNSAANEHHDQMTQVIERSRPNGTAVPQIQSLVDLNVNEETYSDGEDHPSPSSYHSGDSDEYEMDHRPVLERTAVKRDIRSFTESLTLLREGVDGFIPFKVTDRLGEGTFSSVYLANDCLHQEYSNEYWTGRSDYLEPGEQPREVKVALKKILVTSSPARIVNELAILEALRGCRNVSQLITAFREEDQIIIVLPYHQSDDFRHFYRHMDPPHMRLYLRSLFRALKDIHKRGIVHRDVKPANFLFDYASGDGVLVDFGLAERYCPPRKPTCQHAPATLASLQGSKIKTSETPAVEQAVYDARKRSRQGEGRVGFPHEDKRPTIKTNRAGTRGFRAPEVLLKCPDQTVSIDIWSAGVMLLSILTHKFPVFNSTDDIEALMEIAAIFGRAAMERCALLHNRTMMTNVPTVDSHPPTLSALVLKLNPHIYTPHMTNPSPADAKEHIESIDQAIDLCQRLLRLDSTKRLTADQALRHPFLAPGEGEDEEAEPEDEVLDPTEGKCGDLHEVIDGKHRAYFHPELGEMQFGQGVPATRDSLCAEHEHYQQRYQINPLSTRQWLAQAVEDAEPDTEDEGDLEIEGDGEEDGFVIEQQHPDIGSVNGRRYIAAAPLKERDVNAHPPPGGAVVSNGKVEYRRRISVASKREIAL